MMFARKITVVLASLLALGACGGGSGPFQEDVVAPLVSETEPIAPPDPISRDMPPIADEETGAPLVAVDPSDPLLLATLAAMNADQTTISSTALVTDPVTGARSVLTRDGLYTRIDGALSLADLAITLNSDVAGDYDNAASFSQADAVGIVGLATPLDDLRTTGDARFTGGAAGFVIGGASGVDLINGRSVVGVDFNTGLVDVTLDDFEGVSQISGLVVDAPISQMMLTDAVIADGGFSGGTLTLRDANGPVDVTGSGTSTVSQGQFFGLDADGITPDEVGGLILSEGDSGIVYGTFIAD